MMQELVSLGVGLSNWVRPHVMEGASLLEKSFYFLVEIYFWTVRPYKITYNQHVCNELYLILTLTHIQNSLYDIFFLANQNHNTRHIHQICFSNTFLSMFLDFNLKNGSMPLYLYEVRLNSRFRGKFSQYQFIFTIAIQQLSIEFQIQSLSKYYV